MTTELQNLVVRLWQRAYLDSHEQAASQIEEYCQKQAEAISKDRDYYKELAEKADEVVKAANVNGNVNFYKLEAEYESLKSKLSSHE